LIPERFTVRFTGADAELPFTSPPPLRDERFVVGGALRTVDERAVG
jgi:hypothetical protein